MKKVITICISLALILALSAPALAEIDLSAMSFAELAELRTQVQLEMFARQEWQAVQVPQGIYLVGRDIPAGQWTVKAVPKSMTYIEIGTNLADGGMKLTIPYKVTATIYDQGAKLYSAGKSTEYAITVEDGDYITIDMGNAIFETFTGLKLGFK